MLENQRVKIVRDTVSHRIPIGNIVRLKSEAPSHRGKKCYNVLDYCCYVSEDDIEILDNNQEYDRPILINEKPVQTSKKIEKKEEDWFEEYAKAVPKIDTNKTKKFQKGDIVYAKNVTSLSPNGMMNKAKDGVYTIIQVANSKYWLRSDDPNDLNEYFSKDLELKKRK